MKKGRLSAVQLDGLGEGLEWSRAQLAPFRSQRDSAVKQLVGPYYGTENSGDHVPINLIKLAASIYRRLLAPKRVKACVTTKRPALRSFANTFSLNLNHSMREIQFDATLRNVVMESLLGFGVVKLGVNPSNAQVNWNGVMHNADQTFCDVVSLDDWVHDMEAKTWAQVSFCGNRYRMRLDVAQGYAGFDPKARANLTECDPMTNEDGDSRVEAISGGSGRHAEGLYQYCELWELWLPDEGIVVTLPADSAGFTPDNVLAEREWTGPEHGPFRVLSFLDVPSNTMPLAPSMDWRSQHDLANSLLRKLARQAERQKTNLLYTRAAAKDVANLRDASDGEAVASDNPQMAREVAYGGIHQGNMAFLVYMRDLFTYAAGNLDSLAGLSPQSATVGQDQLISQAANAVADDMKEATVEFAGECIKDIAFYDWDNPILRRDLTKTIPGFPEFQVPVQFDSDRKEGDFLDYNIEINPYSMVRKNPQNELQAITLVWNQFVLPALPIMAQQGLMPNMENLLKKIGKKLDIDELDEFFTFQQMDMDPEKAVVGGLSMKSNTPRRYIRENVSTRTRSGTDKTIMTGLMGGGTGDMNKMLGA